MKEEITHITERHFPTIHLVRRLTKIIGRTLPGLLCFVQCTTHIPERHLTDSICFPGHQYPSPFAMFRIHFYGAATYLRCEYTSDRELSCRIAGGRFNFAPGDSAAFHASVAAMSTWVDVPTLHPTPHSHTYTTFLLVAPTVDYIVQLRSVDADGTVFWMPGEHCYYWIRLVDWPESDAVLQGILDQDGTFLEMPAEILF